ncbi:MAG TPA: enolase C-terminal domain-like protein [Thermomicrobiales bacterium]|nr:enolase C-terminal domain-like protein [Thermomicrobiales bacterium]
MSTLTGIEVGHLDGRRPRHAGRNARLGDHGVDIRVTLARVTADDGSTGFGPVRADRDQLAALVGVELDDAVDPVAGVKGELRSIEFPLLDMMARREGVPVYRLLGGHVPAATDELRVPCYDTSLYFDDLHLESHDEAAALIANQALEGLGRGHRAFKIKVGRGARHMPLEEGTKRDILVVRAVREAVGPDARLMLDANNGYNLNLARRVLSETADCEIFWLEEAFHEDAVLYRELKEWMAQQGLGVLIADGEGDASARLLEWARDGLIDVVQYDIFSHGISRWLETGRQLQAWGVATAPHHYGTIVGNYAACHLAPTLRNFLFAEWDEGVIAGVRADGYTIRDGAVIVPGSPGFGLELDGDLFARAVASNGFSLST